MADIDNMRGDTLRVVEENTLDNMRGVTQRVISENSIDNTRGVTYRVYNVNPAPAPVIDELNVTPSTSAQVITAPEGTDGYSPVNVAAVTSAIDANITAGNIKKDVSILGVTGSYEGNVPTGTMYIISNGTYNVADKAIANVQVPTTAPDHYLEFVNNSGTLVKKVQQIDLTGISDPGTALNYLFVGSSLIENTTLSLSPIITISQQKAFTYFLNNVMAGNNFNLHVDCSSIKTINGGQTFEYAFSNTSSYTGTGVLSFDFSGLETINATWAFGQAFRYTPIKEISFPKLSVITGQLASSSSMFRNCTTIESVSFGGLKSTTFTNLKTQLQYLFDSTSGSTAPNGCTVHFPSNFDPSDPNHTFDASTLTGYPTFGGSASYIHLAYDLPATE